MARKLLCAYIVDVVIILTLVNVAEHHATENPDKDSDIAASHSCNLTNHSLEEDYNAIPAGYVMAEESKICDMHYDQTAGGQPQTISNCAARCDSDTTCVGFSWNPIPTKTGQQFCIKCTDKSALIDDTDPWNTYAKASFTMCSQGYKRGRICCSRSCAVCGGPGCFGKCCGHYIVTQGECKNHQDTSCMIGLDPKGRERTGFVVRHEWCARGVRSRDICCEPTCQFCAGLYCMGTCCASFVKKQGHCKNSGDVNCVIPEKQAPSIDLDGFQRRIECSGLLELMPTAKRIPALEHEGPRQVNIVSVACDYRASEAFVMIKSIALHANLMTEYNVIVFVNQLAADALSNPLGSFAEVLSSHHVNVKLQLIDMKIPHLHLYSKCASLSMVLPTILHDLDSIIYINSDTIWQDDPANMWQVFEKFDLHHTMGASLTYKGKPVDTFLEDARHLALNAGVLLWNLTRARAVQENRILWNITESQEKKAFQYGDQSVIKIYLHRDPWRFFDLPCQYNLNLLQYCRAAKDAEPALLHGLTGSFHQPGLMAGHMQQGCLWGRNYAAMWRTAYCWNMSGKNLRFPWPNC